MKQVLRMALMVLLAAAAGVGSARGEKEEYTDGNGVTWEYEEIEAGATCRIGIPERNRGSISGFVEIPGTVEVDGVSIKVVRIEDEAFSRCSGLTAVTIPDSVKKIGYQAFKDCIGLMTVTIPGSVTGIDYYAFFGCSGLKSFEVESGNKNYCAEGGVLFTKDKASLICYPGGKPEESYTIPSSVTAIGACAFAGCSGLKGVTIPSSVTAIGGNAFDRCSGLTAVTIPGGVKTIGHYAFQSCSGLTAVTIHDGVTKIGWGAFSGCIGLTAVTIPSSVTEIGMSAFSVCKGLKSIEVESGNKNYCAAGGVLFTKDKATLICYPAGKPEESYTIPGSVTEIGDRAFSDCSGLMSLEVKRGNKFYCAASGVLFTKDKATLICYPAGKPEESYTIPSSVTKIRDYAFKGCDGLTAVTIPGSVTEIGEGAFAWCSGLTAVTIPDGVKRIGWDAFQGCSGLKLVEVESGNENYCAAGGVLFTKDKATLICYPGGKAEESYTIPGSVTEIGGYGFAGCDGLKDVTIPGRVTKIGEGAFAWCSGLNAVYWLAGAGCAVDNIAFGGIDLSAILYVRQGEKAAIEGNGKTWWQVFSKIEEGYVVTFKDGEGNKLGEQLVRSNGTATAPTAPAKEGYIVEWQLDGKKYDFSKKVEKDITLVAKWKKKEESTPSTPKDPETTVESVQLVGVRSVRNPVGEALELEGMERAVRMEVYSVVGARVHAEALRGEPRVVIDAQGWASGVYVVRVEASDGAKTLRVVK